MVVEDRKGAAGRSCLSSRLTTSLQVPSTPMLKWLSLPDAMAYSPPQSLLPCSELSRRLGSGSSGWTWAASTPLNSLGVGLSPSQPSNKLAIKTLISTGYNGT
ncbi:uncharacterized protein PGTG_20936 [Puccinia graminis f. sp. tritici CRL 75-36-700-3]|uniref:Uncharacterized protein n=1 Tax=Puccinia graminis f. sp. tritici (strain CRL 75-36-700-3 / race SCCL) TaxID=418459 RepID=H6QPT8_PUCGT|nr:uncharacterized protein PGTG_20936 [Puccinia graminis f. sp. tritici CRL 75-36-700-3]EHS64325.1 hypothetical protein PGTG_20936 [Puccinia graminis f. sp. tritici CRL 75-36-700-3]